MASDDPAPEKPKAKRPKPAQVAESLEDLIRPPTVRDAETLKQLSDQAKLMEAATANRFADIDLGKITQSNAAWKDIAERLAKLTGPSTAMVDALGKLDEANKTTQKWRMGLAASDLSRTEFLTTMHNPDAEQVEATQAVEAAIGQLIRVMGDSIDALSDVSRAQLTEIGELKGGIAEVVTVTAAGQKRADRTDTWLLRLTIAIAFLTAVLAAPVIISVGSYLLSLSPHR